jgi:branched-chain amino acid transport system substrate-binding protein
VTDDEVVFGMTTPLSGPAAAYSAVSRGAQAWVAEVNEKGGINGRRIRLLVKDDGFVPGRAVANVTEMKDAVLAMVGMIGTSCLNATKDLLAEAGVPNVSISGNPRVFARQSREKRRYVFGQYPDYESDGTFLVRQAREQIHVRRLAAFYENDDFGRDCLAGVKVGVAERQGVNLVAEVPYEVQDRDLSLHALELKESGAEAVILCAINAAAANAVKEMAGAGYRPKLLGAFVLADHGIMFRLLGELWEGAYFSAGWPHEDPDWRRTSEVVVARDPTLRGRELTGTLGASYMMVALEALRRAGREITRESYAAAFEGMSDVTLAGVKVSFSPERHHGRNRLRLFRAGRASDNSATPATEEQDFPPVF